jgi:hypothetical protein
MSLLLPDLFPRQLSFLAVLPFFFSQSPSTRRRQRRLSTLLVHRRPASGLLTAVLTALSPRSILSGNAYLVGRHDDGAAPCGPAARSPWHDLPPAHPSAEASPWTPAASPLFEFVPPHTVASSRGTQPAVARLDHLFVPSVSNVYFFRFSNIVVNSECQ